MQTEGIPLHFMDSSYSEENSILKYSEYTSFFYGFSRSPHKIFCLLWRLWILPQKCQFIMLNFMSRPLAVHLLKYSVHILENSMSTWICTHFIKPRIFKLRQIFQCRQSYWGTLDLNNVCNQMEDICYKKDITTESKLPHKM